MDAKAAGMILNQSFAIPDRRQAALRLGQKLIRHRNSDSVIFGIPYGGAVVGYNLAKKLSLCFDVIGCRPIPHPADQRRTIKSKVIISPIIKVADTSVRLIEKSFSHENKMQSD